MELIRHSLIAGAAISLRSVSVGSMCLAPLSTPADVNETGHGTHVMGTMVGREISGSDTNTVGAAPDAQWIACNAIGQAITSEMDNDVISAYEWFADPDRDPSTLDDVPDVIQNSWGVYEELPGYVACFDYWNSVILNCEAAGPVFIWSAGNEGRRCGDHSQSCCIFLQ